MTRASAIFKRLFLSISWGLFAGLVVLAGSVETHAGQTVATGDRPADKFSVAGFTTTEFSAQQRRVVRRAPSRVPVYGGSRNPGPKAVRVCDAYYAQEFRPSGTVIVPRMRCTWRG